MKFKITRIYEDKHDPNEVGEYLRDWFFDQKNGSETGCYSTFDLAEGVEELPAVRRTEEYAEEDWHHLRKAGIDCFWAWDGDGTLVFRMTDGGWLINTDCKKDYVWEYSKQRPEWLDFL